MKKLPKHYKLMKEIARILDNHLNSQKEIAEIRSTELYVLILRNRFLEEQFPTPRVFNQFLREMHQKNLLGSFIAYRCDDSDFEKYQWYFRANRL